MKPPIITPSPSDKAHTATTTTNTPPSLPTITTITTTAQQQQQQLSTNVPNDVITTPVTNSISSQSNITNAQTIPTTQVQQAPLALTTQTQAKTQVTAPPQILNQAPTSINQSQLTPQILQLKTKIQSPQVSINTPTQQPQPIPLATTPTSTGPTALVIIPQHSTTATVIPPPTPKSSTITTKSIPITTSVVTGVPTAHVTIPTITQSAPIHLQTPTTHVPNIAPVPMTAHQQSTTIVTPTIANRPPSTLSVVPITATSASIKAEPTKYTCCLLDNGVRCDRVAGNASFSARIQKIVKTKEMNYNLDSSVRHTYICEHHKAIITVAKKSTMARDTKANARNYAANNNATNIAPQPNVNYNDFSMRPQTLQHPVNLEMMANQNRLANNHTGVLNNVPVRPGAQIAYGHYQGPHQNQVNFDNLGGDSAPSSSGGVDVDLQQLQVNTLRRYKRHFRVQTRPGLNKMQLAESLKSHFRTLPIIEKEAITYFVYIVKCYRNKLDHNPKAD